MAPLELDAVLPRSALTATEFDGLSADPAKREAYRYDTYAREGLRSFSALTDLTRSHEFTFVVLKPDAVAGRRCELILEILRSQGWLPAAATTIRFDPLLTRELWRYQFNAASAQRIAVVDHLLGSGPALLVLLHDTRRPAGMPASVRLTAAKGSADPEAARGTDLRSRIGRVNGLFNFIHTADDPADVIRELQLFSYQAGWDWCARALREPGQVADGWSPERDPAYALLAQVHAAVPAHDLDLTAALRRLRGGGGRWAELAQRAGTREQVGQWLDALGPDRLPAGPARWDVLTVVTGWIDCNERGVAPLLSTPSAAAWQPADDDGLRSEQEGDTCLV
ncbi:nucleoside-diphosphate kinase [Kitasatospora sp. NPDC048540]|uniref:nucleoside-diphosphate kinase n=1 Tax=Kitasatospora sp. NPDC048540 TaxID=3155634 RepID=UPI00341092B2